MAVATNNGGPLTRSLKINSGNPSAVPLIKKDINDSRRRSNISQSQIQNITSPTNVEIGQAVKDVSSVILKRSNTRSSTQMLKMIEGVSSKKSDDLAITVQKSGSQISQNEDPGTPLTLIHHLNLPASNQKPVISRKASDVKPIEPLQKPSDRALDKKPILKVSSQPQLSRNMSAPMVDVDDNDEKTEKGGKSEQASQKEVLKMITRKSPKYKANNNDASVLENTNFDNQKFDRAAVEGLDRWNNEYKRFLQSNSLRGSFPNI